MLVISPDEPGDEASHRATPCRVDARTVRGCSLRELLGELAASAASEPVTIRIPDGRWIAESPDPLPIRGSVRLVGRGATRDVLDGANLGPIFAIAAGSRLTLDHLAVVRGLSQGALHHDFTLRLIRSYASEGWMLPDDPELIGPFWCDVVPTRTGERSKRRQLFADVTVSDERAASTLPGLGITEL